MVQFTPRLSNAYELMVFIDKILLPAVGDASSEDVKCTSEIADPHKRIVVYLVETKNHSFKFEVKDIRMQHPEIKITYHGDKTLLAKCELLEADFYYKMGLTYSPIVHDRVINDPYSLLIEILLWLEANTKINV